MSQSKIQQRSSDSAQQLGDETFMSAAEFDPGAMHASRPPGCVRDPIDDIAYQAKFCAPPGCR
jgi:hypothetical protein